MKNKLVYALMMMVCAQGIALAEEDEEFNFGEFAVEKNGQKEMPEVQDKDGNDQQELKEQEAEACIEEDVQNEPTLLAEECEQNADQFGVTMQSDEIAPADDTHAGTVTSQKSTETNTKEPQVKHEIIEIKLNILFDTKTGKVAVEDVEVVQ